MDVNTLKNAMGNPAVAYEHWLAGVNDAMKLGAITNVPRAAMFLAQVGAESGGLHWMEELADGSEYNGRKDLGNTQPGDGPRFKGRGPIQITGRNNYTQLSTWAHQKGRVPTADYFVQHPTDLALPQYVWLGPIWYWTVARPNLNTLSDHKDIQGATQAINGGLNGLQDRTQRWQHCLSLGNAILPS